MGTKMGPSYANLFVGYVENQFFNQYNGPQPKLNRRYIEDCVGATSSTREELEQFINSVKSFHPALKYTWQISKPASLFSTWTFQFTTTSYQLVCTTNLKTPIAICCTRLITLTMLKTPFHFLNSSDFDVSVEMSLTSPTNQRKCSSSSKTVATLIQLWRRLNNALKQLINRQRHKRHTRKKIREPFTLTFHPLNLPVKNIILKNFKLLQNDNETSRIFSLPPLISFKHHKNISDFLVRSTLKSDESLGTFNYTRKRCKTCPFIHNIDKVTGPKRSIKIPDRFTCISANVIYCIYCA